MMLNLPMRRRLHILLLHYQLSEEVMHLEDRFHPIEVGNWGVRYPLSQRLLLYQDLLKFPNQHAFYNGCEGLQVLSRLRYRQYILLELDV